MTSRLTCVLLLLVLLTACQPLTPAAQTPTLRATRTPSIKPTPTKLVTWRPIGDGGLLDNNPCGPPCFFGIFPGGTSEEGAWELVRKNEHYFFNCETVIYPGYAADKGIKCDYQVFISISDGVVEDLVFQPTDLITIQDVVEKYGPPELVYVYSDTLPDFVPEASMWVLYLSDQFSLKLPDQEFSFYTLSPDTKIINIGYFAEDYFGNDRLKIGVPWHGYGEYEITVP